MKKMMVSKNATKGGGGMDIATKRDALAERLAKTASAALKSSSRLSDQDVLRAMSMARGMVSKNYVQQEADIKSRANKLKSYSLKAKGGKVKK
jgi:hypothetical protein